MALALGSASFLAPALSAGLTAGGSAAGSALGGLAVQGIYNVLTGNGPIQRRKRAKQSSSGCTCEGPASKRVKYTCEQKYIINPLNS